MFLHLGEDTVVRDREIVGIFDLDNTTVSSWTRDFLTAAEKSGRVRNVSDGLPKTFVLAAAPADGARGGERERVYICLLSARTLGTRTQVKEICEQYDGRKEHEAG